MNLRQKLPPFDYTMCAVTDEEKLEKRPKKLMDDGTKYDGEWDITTNRQHGRGAQEYPDGSYYEGAWVQGQVSGKGRLIHADGDVYVGDWVNGQAHGFGEYTHTDGAIYTG